jgi:hypothetical protein
MVTPFANTAQDAWKAIGGIAGAPIVRYAARPHRQSADCPALCRSPPHTARIMVPATGSVKRRMRQSSAGGQPGRTALLRWHIEQGLSPRLATIINRLFRPRPHAATNAVVSETRPMPASAAHHCAIVVCRGAWRAGPKLGADRTEHGTEARPAHDRGCPGSSATHRAA